MGTQVLDYYQIPRHHYPLTLYRIDYPGAQATYDSESGFQAAGSFTPYHVTGLRRAVEYHLNWRSRIPSPFISAFRNRQHAENWANVWRGNNDYQRCYMIEMRIDADDGVVLFRLGYLVDRLGISTPLLPSQYSSEYLCFRQIPAEVVVGRYAIPPGMEYGYTQD